LKGRRSDAALREAVCALPYLDHDLGLLVCEILDRRLRHELGLPRFQRSL